MFKYGAQYVELADSGSIPYTASFAVFNKATAMNIDLPDLTKVSEGYVLFCKNRGLGLVTVRGVLGQLIEGLASFTMATATTQLMISDGNGWVRMM